MPSAAPVSTKAVRSAHAAATASGDRGASRLVKGGNPSCVRSRSAAPGTNGAASAASRAARPSAPRMRPPASASPSLFSTAQGAVSCRNLLPAALADIHSRTPSLSRAPSIAST